MNDSVTCCTRSRFSKTIFIQTRSNDVYVTRGNLNISYVYCVRKQKHYNKIISFAEYSKRQFAFKFWTPLKISNVSTNNNNNKIYRTKNLRFFFSCRRVISFRILDNFIRLLEWKTGIKSHWFAQIVFVEWI